MYYYFILTLFTDLYRYSAGYIEGPETLQISSSFFYGPESLLLSLQISKQCFQAAFY